MAELATAAVAVGAADQDPLAPVMALAPIDLTPAGVPVLVWAALPWADLREDHDEAGGVEVVACAGGACSF